MIRLGNITVMLKNVVAIRKVTGGVYNEIREIELIDTTGDRRCYAISAADGDVIPRIARRPGSGWVKVGEWVVQSCNLHDIRVVQSGLDAQLGDIYHVEVRFRQFSSRSASMSEEDCINLMESIAGRAHG